MSKLNNRFFFSFIIPALLSCQQVRIPEPELFLTVIDVGQGLSQMARVNSNALVWDMGPEECRGEWFNVYQEAGHPQLQAVIISHRDLDHSGGLQFLDSTVDWSGIIVTSIYEDTAGIRGLCKRWPGKIMFRMVCKGDTLGYLPGISIRCLWPPSAITDSIPVQNSSINKYSLVFHINFKGTSALITSDIDSVAAFDIANFYKETLSSDIMIIPHHGSAGSLNRIFLGYIDPGFSIISCGKNNRYNHPSEPVISFLSTMGTNIRITSMHKTLSFNSNGYYWRGY